MLQVSELSSNTCNTLPQRCCKLLRVTLSPLTFLLNERVRVGDLKIPYLANNVALIESFKLEYEYEIKYEYDFRISNQLCSQSPCLSQLLISRGGRFRNNIGVLFDDLDYVLSV